MACDPIRRDHPSQFIATTTRRHRYTSPWSRPAPQSATSLSCLPRRRCPLAWSRAIPYTLDCSRSLHRLTLAGTKGRSPPQLTIRRRTNCLLVVSAPQPRARVAPATDLGVEHRRTLRVASRKELPVQVTVAFSATGGLDTSRRPGSSRWAPASRAGVAHAATPRPPPPAPRWPHGTVAFQGSQAPACRPSPPCLVL